MPLLLRGSVELGLIYGLTALGVLITYRILNLPDLTVDGSFVTGMACAAVIAQRGHPFMSLAAAAAFGAAAGCITGFLHTKMGIQPILSGILTMTGLYTVNLYIMGGKSNISFYGQANIFSAASKLGISKLIAICIIAALSIAFCCVFFKTRAGLAIRAVGDNEEMAKASSINSDGSKILAFAISNALTAISGAVLAHYQSSVDVGYGNGMVVIALASVVIGESFPVSKGISISFAFAAIGSVFYRIIIAYALKLEVLPTYGVKLASAVIVAIAISLPRLRAMLPRGESRHSDA
ncbi:MAG: ABC transporter permease [Eubacteriaceae bacterium]|nr:ABC transporter permease [Eubacteriaceae bacterium]